MKLLYFTFKNTHMKNNNKKTPRPPNRCDYGYKLHATISSNIHLPFKYNASCCIMRNSLLTFHKNVLFSSTPSDEMCVSCKWLAPSLNSYSSCAIALFKWFCFVFFPFIYILMLSFPCARYDDFVNHLLCTVIALMVMVMEQWWQSMAI